MSNNFIVTVVETKILKFIIFFIYYNKNYFKIN